MPSTCVACPAISACLEVLQDPELAAEVTRTLLMTVFMVHMESRETRTNTAEDVASSTPESDLSPLRTEDSTATVTSTVGFPSDDEQDITEERTATYEGWEGINEYGQRVSSSDWPILLFCV